MIDEAQIKEFAAEFDPQPFHLDETASQASVFKGLAASGWHMAAVAMRLLVTGGLPFANGIVGLGGEISWPPADTPRRPSARRERNRRTHTIAIQAAAGSRAVRSTMLNQNGEAVYVLNAKVLH